MATAGTGTGPDQGAIWKGIDVGSFQAAVTAAQKKYGEKTDTCTHLFMYVQNNTLKFVAKEKWWWQRRKQVSDLTNPKARTQLLGGTKAADFQQRIAELEQVKTHIGAGTQNACRQHIQPDFIDDHGNCGKQAIIVF